MGTRGVIGYRINGTDKVTYRHLDAFPEALGMETLEYISKTSIRRMKGIAKKIKVVKHFDTSPSKSEIKMYAETRDLLKKNQCNLWRHVRVFRI